MYETKGLRFGFGWLANRFSVPVWSSQFDIYIYMYTYMLCMICNQSFELKMNNLPAG